MKLTVRQKLAIIGEVLSETSAGGLFMLQLILAVMLWMLLSGAGQIIGILPNWALALGGSGIVCLALAAIGLKKPKFIFLPLGMVALLALQIGGAGVLIPDENQTSSPRIGRGHFPSFAELVNCFSWVVVIGLAVGGFMALCMLAEDFGKKRNTV